MKKGEIIVAKAIEFLGTKENPTNSNNVIFNTHYYGYPVSGQNYPWCVTFVWDVFRQCGLSKYFYDGKKTASCGAVRSWGARVGIMYGSFDNAQAGDLILFDFDKDGKSDHIGIIEKFENNKFITIEGNTSTSNDSNGGEVMRRIRNPYQIDCIIIRPPYDDNFCFVDETKSLIKKGQQELNIYVKNNLIVDGIRGTATKKASIKALQKSLEISVDGIIGNQTKTAISKILLKKGNKSFVVSVVEILLYLKGYDANGIEYPGFFANGLYNAVVKFQKDKKLEVDGIVGKNTIMKLLE